MNKACRTASARHIRSNAKNMASQRSIILAAAVFLMALMLGGLTCSCREDKIRYDFTGQLENIESIEFISIISLYDYYSGSDSGAEVLKSIPENQWEGVLSAAAKLEYYRPFPNPTFLREGEALKITFKEPVDGKVFVLYSRYAFSDAEIIDGETNIDSYAPQCSEEDWESFTKLFR